MPSNKKPKRKFDPKRHPVMKTQFALTAEESAHIKLPPRTAYQAFLTGDGNLTLWRTISVRLNVLTAIVKPLPEYHDIAHNAAVAMVAVRDRANARGIWVFHGSEARAIVEALNACDDAHDQMRRTELNKAYESAYSASKKLARAGLMFAPLMGALETGAGA